MTVIAGMADLAELAELAEIAVMAELAEVVADAGSFAGWSGQKPGPFIRCSES
jgi:hypothetical protein